MVQIINNLERQMQDIINSPIQTNHNLKQTKLSNSTMKLNRRANQFKKSQTYSSESEDQDQTFKNQEPNKKVQKTTFKRQHQGVVITISSSLNSNFNQSSQTQDNPNNQRPKIYNDIQRQRQRDTNRNFQGGSNIACQKKNKNSTQQNMKFKKQQMYTTNRINQDKEVKYENEQIYTSAYLSKTNGQNQQLTQTTQYRKAQKNVQIIPQTNNQRRSQRKRDNRQQKSEGQYKNKQKKELRQKKQTQHYAKAQIKRQNQQNYHKKQEQSFQAQQNINKCDEAFLNISKSSNNNSNDISYQQNEISQYAYNNRQNESHQIMNQSNFLQDASNNRKNNHMNHNKKNNKQKKESSGKKNKSNKFIEDQSSDWSIECDNQNQDQDDFQRSPENKKRKNEQDLHNLSKRIKEDEISFINSQNTLDAHNMANLSIHPDDEEEFSNIINQFSQPKSQKKNKDKHEIEKTSQSQNQMKMYNEIKSKILFNVQDQQNLLHFLQKHKISQIQSNIELAQRISLHIKIQSTNLSKIWIKKVSLPCFGIKNYKIVKNVNQYNENSQNSNQKKFITINKNWTGVLNSINIAPHQPKQKSQIYLCEILDPYRCIQLYEQCKNNQKMFEKSSQGQNFKKEMQKIIQKMRKILKSSQKSFKQLDPVQQEIYANLVSNKFNFLKIQEIKIGCRACYTKTQSLFLDEQNFQRVHCEKCEGLMTIEITQEIISQVKSKNMQPQIANDQS